MSTPFTNRNSLQQFQLLQEHKPQANIPQRFWQYLRMLINSLTKQEQNRILQLPTSPWINSAQHSRTTISHAFTVLLITAPGHHYSVLNPTIFSCSIGDLPSIIRSVVMFTDDYTTFNSITSPQQMKQPIPASSRFCITIQASDIHNIHATNMSGID